jgi:hypothetical protein
MKAATITYTEDRTLTARHPHLGLPSGRLGLIMT